MECWHVTCSTDSRSRLYADEETLRRATRSVARVVGRHALLFCIVDDHLHLVLAGARAATGQRAGGLARALRPIQPAARFDPARVRPVEGRRHLLSLVTYLLSQPRRHGLAADPALWTGSCFQDLVGARRLSGYDGHLLRMALPRWRPASVVSAVGMDSLPPPLPEPRLPALGLEQIARAASAAFAAPSSLRGRTPAAVRAKRALVALTRGAAFPPAAIAHRLGCSLRQVQRLAAVSAPREDLVVVCRQLALRETRSCRAR